MGDGLHIALIVLFGAHLLAFAALWWRRRQPHLLWLVLTFMLLVSSSLVTLLAPTLSLGGLTLSWHLRIAAWSASAVAVVALIRRRLMEKKAR